MNRVDDLSNAALLKEVGRRIANLRIAARIKQADLAAKAGLSRYALSRLENGAGGIRLDSFLSVLRCLNVLNRIDAVLPESTLSPIQVAELGSRAKKMPNRIRSSRGGKGLRTWGDGVSATI